MQIDKTLNLYIFWGIMMGFIFIERLAETFAKRKKEKGEIKKKWTFTIMMYFHFFFFFATIIEFLFRAEKINIVVSGFGIILYLTGLILRNLSIKSLDKYWSVHIEIRDNHQLIREGPYKYIRHPAYLAIIFEIMGIPLIGNAYLTLLFNLFVYVPIILLRIFYEEKELIYKFGNIYIQYSRETNGLIPFVKNFRNFSSPKFNKSNVKIISGS